jgi:hypothetical protein
MRSCSLLCVLFLGCASPESRFAKAEGTQIQVRIEPPDVSRVADGGDASTLPVIDASVGSTVLALGASVPVVLSASAEALGSQAPFPVGDLPVVAKTLREVKRTLDATANARFDSPSPPYDAQRLNKVVPSIFASHQAQSKLPAGARTDVPLRYEGLWLASIQESGERLILVYGPRYVVVVAGDVVERIVDFIPASLQIASEERRAMDLSQVIYAGGVLYACGEYHGHPMPREGQITAVDVATGRLRWRSQKQVCGGTLAVMGDYVLTGYGADILPYQFKLLRRYDGKLMQSLPNVGAAFDILVEPDNENFIVETYKHRITYHLK